MDGRLLASADALSLAEQGFYNNNRRAAVLLLWRSHGSAPTTVEQRLDVSGAYQGA